MPPSVAAIMRGAEERPALFAWIMQNATMIYLARQIAAVGIDGVMPRN